MCPYLTPPEEDYIDRFSSLFPAARRADALAEALGECEAFRDLEGRAMTQEEVEGTMDALDRLQEEGFSLLKSYRWGR